MDGIQMHQRKSAFSWQRGLSWTLAVTTVCSTLPAWGQVDLTEAQPLRVVVNSDRDTVQPDEGITLREAILLVNGELAIANLSPTEAAQVESLSANAAPLITFDLPPGQSTIQLQSVLPPLAAPGLTVDGSTQSGYDPTGSATAEIEIPIPVVSITPAPGQEVFRGLTIVADGVTVRGLSLYGFTSFHGRTASTPPADIFISHPLPPPDTSRQRPPASNFPFRNRDLPPLGVTLENNWLGLPPDGSFPETPSAFGVYVFNSKGATIRRNYIANHDGSGIITSVQAQNLNVLNNIVINNGLAGMPDGIRMEGVISNSTIQGNLVCGNDGSGVYLFKPDGAIAILENDIKFNGRRFRRAAVYLMGSDHQVLDNSISYQTGPGVVVAGYPDSKENIIRGNRFLALEGLSIDLVTYNHNTPQAYQVGDGPNPPRNSPNRRLDTGNAAINAPELIRSDLGPVGEPVSLFGTADPGSTVDVYRVVQAPASEFDRFPGYAPLTEFLETVQAGEDGEFQLTLPLEPTDQISAIATIPEYGTSEPAPIVSVGGPDVGVPPSVLPEIPQCVSAPVEPEPAPEPEPLLPTEPLRLNVPRNIHFALDQATISPESADILDQIAAVLKEYPFLTVTLEGHTDPRASDAYNLDLSNRRSLAARNYLIRQGIAPERMTIRALGESQRLTEGSSRLDYARDRRVEFTFEDLRGLDIIFERQETDLQIESP